MFGADDLGPTAGCDIMKHVPWEKPEEAKLVLYGDWGWFLVRKRSNPTLQFVGYTWRHRIRLWIGLDGKIGREWCFKRVKFRGKLHKFLNKVM